MLVQLQPDPLMGINRIIMDRTMTIRKSPAQIQQEIDDHLKEMRSLESEASAGSMTSANTGITYDRISADPSSRRARRWIGKCKRCGAAHRVDGQIFMGHIRGNADQVIRSRDRRLLTTSAMGTDPSLVSVPCGDHRCMLRQVVEGTKKSKHVCGARCTNATGPNCDCRCRGANHGSNLSP